MLLILKDSRHKHKRLDGTGVNVLTRCAALKDLGAMVAVVYDQQDDEFCLQMEHIGVPMFYIKFGYHYLRFCFKWTNFFVWIKLWLLIRQLGITKIHCHHPQLLASIPPWVNRMDISCHNHAWFAEGTFHSNVKNTPLMKLRKYSKDNQFCLNRASKVISVSNSADSFVKRDLKYLDDTKFFVLLNSPRSDIKCAMPAKKIKKCTSILTLGNISREKGFFDLVLLAEKVPTLEFFWYGSPTAEVNRYTRDKPVPDNLHINGYSTSVDRLYEKTDVLLIPSHREAMSNTALEAFQFGVPLLAWDIEPMRDLAELGFKVDLCNAFDTDDIIDRLNTVHLRWTQSDISINRKLVNQINSQSQARKFIEILGF